MGNNMTTANTVQEVDAGYTLNLPLWQQVRAAIRGKQGAIDLLGCGGYYGIVAPQYRQTPENLDQCNKRRLAYFARGRFFNATGRTHDAFVGMIGSSNVDSEFPTQLEGMESNIDGENATVNDFALEASSEVLTTARYGILVDPPNLSGGTLADANIATPKLIGYKAEQIRRSVVDGGKLVMVELAETYIHKDGDKYETKEQVRRLELIDGMYSSIIKREGAVYAIDEATINGSRLDYIPFQFVGAENNKPTYDRPVMFDLAHENMGHFQLSCDNLENLHFHGQGMTNIFTDDTDSVTDANPNGVDVGAKGTNIFKAQDRVEILQIAATGAIPTEMEKVEKRMIMLGAQVVQDTNTNQTLGAKEIEANASVSQLKRIANNVSAGMTQCSKWAAEMVGANPDEVSIKVNDRFITDSMAYQDVTAMFAMYQGGAATLEELNEVKRKAGYTQKTNEELADALDEEGPEGDSEEVARLKMELDNLKAQIAGGE